MATTLLGEMHGSPEFSETEDGTRTYTRRFRVEATDVADGPKKVAATAGIPRKYNPYSYRGEVDLAAQVTEIIATREVDAPLFWAVEVRYSTQQTDSKDEQENNKPPLERKPKYQWFFVKHQEIVVGGFQNSDSLAANFVPNKAVANSAGEVFDPPPMKDAYRLGLRVTRNEATFNPAVALDYQDAVNSDAFLGAAAGQAKINITGSNEVFEKGQRFWNTTYEVLFRKEGWKLRLLDFGNYYLNNGEKVFFTDERGHPRKGLLDGNGGALPDGGQPKFIELDIYQSKPFAPLSLT